MEDKVGAIKPKIALVSKAVGAEGRQTLKAMGFQLREVDAVTCQVGDNEYADAETYCTDPTLIQSVRLQH